MTIVSDASRRRFVGLAIAAAAAAACDRAGFAHPSSGQRATPAQRFADSIGVCTHPNWRGTVWGSSDWPGALKTLGVANIRGKLGSGRAGDAALADISDFLARGGKFCALVANSGQDFDLPAIAKAVDFLASNLGSRHLSAIEGPNEYNRPSRRPEDWAPRLRAFQAWLRDRVRADRRLDGVPIVAPSMWGRLSQDYRTLGNLERNADIGCLHYYTGGRRPSRVGVSSTMTEEGIFADRPLADAISDARILTPGKPLWITEYGYNVAGPGQKLSRHAITEQAAAKYLLRGLFEAFAAGVERTFIYSLLDDRRDPPRYHGLMDQRLRPRASYHAVRNLMALMRDAPARPGPPALLEYSLSAAPDLRSHLFAKQDGSFLLALYREIDSYDRWRARDIAVLPLPVTLSLRAPAARIERFTPTISAAPRERGANVGRLVLPVGDEVTIVRIVP